MSFGCHKKKKKSVLNLSSMFSDCPFTMIEDICSLQGEALACTKKDISNLPLLHHQTAS